MFEFFVIACSLVFLIIFVKALGNNAEAARQHEYEMAKLGYHQEVVWDGDESDPGYPKIWVKDK